MTAPSRRLCRCRAIDLLPTQAHVPPTVDLCLPLHLALCRGHPEVATWLLAHGSPPQATTLKCTSRHVRLRSAAPSTTALHDAARFGRLELIRHILDRGYQADVDVLDRRGLSPLWHAYLAAQCLSTEPCSCCLVLSCAAADAPLLTGTAVDLLLARGADVDDDLGRGYTPLMDACLRSSNHERAVELIARGANVNTALHAAPYRILNQITASDMQTDGVRPIDACCWTRQLCKPLMLSLESLPDEASQTWQPTPSEGWVQYDHGIEGRRTLVSKLLTAGAHLPPAAAHRPPPLVAAAANQYVLNALAPALAPYRSPLPCCSLPSTLSTACRPSSRSSSSMGPQSTFPTRMGSLPSLRFSFILTASAPSTIPSMRG